MWFRACCPTWERELATLLPLSPVLEQSDKLSEASDSPGHLVQFLIGRGGGGHMASARAIRDCLAQRGVAWANNIEFVDTGFLFDSIISGRREKGFDADELYNWLMSRGLYRLAALLSPLGAMVIRASRAKLSRGLVRFWRKRPPAAVVCCVPVSHAVLRSALLSVCPTTPLITVVTDMASSQSHAWMDPYDAGESINQTIVAGSAVLQMQASELGYPSSHVLPTSGMVVHPALYEQTTASPASAPAHAQSTRTTVSGVVFFGGHAPMRVLRIVQSALASFPSLLLVVLCGGNAELLHQLETLNDDRCTAQGLVAPHQIRDHFRAADFIIGKPGPGVVAEAMVCGLPFVTESHTPMAQEQCVLDYLRASGVGVLLPSLEALPPELPRLCAVAKAAAAKLENVAIFEVCDFLQSVVPD